MVQFMPLEPKLEIMVITVIHSPCHFHKYSPSSIPVVLVTLELCDWESENLVGVPTDTPPDPSVVISSQWISDSPSPALKSIMLLRLRAPSTTKKLQKRQLVRRFRGRGFEETRLSRIAEEEEKTLNLEIYAHKDRRWRKSYIKQNGIESTPKSNSKCSSNTFTG